jgi:hypothetical protein
MNDGIEGNNPALLTNDFAALLAPNSTECGFYSVLALIYVNVEYYVSCQEWEMLR